MTMTAGMVRGTPDWQLDLMAETQMAADWERSQPREISRYDVLYPLSDALDHAMDAFDRLASAAEAAEGSVYEARVRSMMDGMEALIDEMRGQKDALKKAVSA